jgi:hypothetical protein
MPMHPMLRPWLVMKGGCPKKCFGHRLGFHRSTNITNVAGVQRKPCVAGSCAVEANRRIEKEAARGSIAEPSVTHDVIP